MGFFQERTIKAIQGITTGDFDEAFLRVATLIDSTARQYYPQKEYRQKDAYIRYLDSVQEEMFLISTYGISVKLDGFKSPKTNEITKIAEAIYAARNSSVHNVREIDESIAFTNDSQFGYDSEGRMLINSGMLIAIVLLLISDGKNRREFDLRSLSHLGFLQHGDISIDLSKCVGRRAELLATYRSLKNRPDSNCNQCGVPGCPSMHLISSWSDAVRRAQRSTYTVRVGHLRELCVLIDHFAGGLVFLATPQLIMEIQKIQNKLERQVVIESIFNKRKIVANVTAFALLGNRGNQVGILWIGNSLKSADVDLILHTLVEIEAHKDELIDLSGGGRILRVSEKDREEQELFAQPSIVTDNLSQARMALINDYRNISGVPCSSFCKVIDVDKGNGVIHLRANPGMLVGGNPVINLHGEVVGILTESSQVNSNQYTASSLARAIQFFKALA